MISINFQMSRLSRMLPRTTRYTRILSSPTRWRPSADSCFRPRRLRRGRHPLQLFHPPSGGRCGGRQPGTKAAPPQQRRVSKPGVMCPLSLWRMSVEICHPRSLPTHSPPRPPKGRCPPSPPLPPRSRSIIFVRTESQTQTRTLS